MTGSSSCIPDTRRVVLGAAVGYDVSQVRIFIESLRANGYGGDIVMLVGPFQFALRSYLRSRGVSPITAWYIRRIHGPIFTYRFELLGAHLRRHAKHYDQALIADVRDVVFQRHPFDGVSDRSCHFFLEAAGWTIGRETLNIGWMQTFLTPDQVTQLRDRPISCCGVSLGGIAAMTAYLDRMTAYLQSVPLRIRRRHGADTAFHNLMAHLTHEVDCTLVRNNQHVATMGLEPAATYAADADGRIRTDQGEVPAILHQYDRIPHVRDAVEARYAVDHANQVDSVSSARTP
jgi:hypothetical protein